MPIGMQADRPSGADKAVIFAVDRRYARFAHFAAAQIAERSPERDFDLCIASLDTIPPLPGLAEHGIRYARIDAGGLFDALHCDRRRPVDAYLRLALPAAFAHEYRRIFYLDADVFVQGGDFSALLDLDIGNHPLAAVRDNIQWRRPRRFPPTFRRLGLGNAAFLNSGALLIDVAAFGRVRVLERCIELAGSIHPARIGLDQDLLNAVLHGGWAELHPTWNWQYTRSSQLFEAIETARVVHFIGAKKPWSHSGGELPGRFREAYRAFFLRHYPEDPDIGPPGSAMLENRRYLGKMLLRHTLSVRAMSDYLARFDDRMTVLR